MEDLGQKCPACGVSIPLSTTEEDSRRRILELEAQVKILTERAFESADKITTYEHEVHTLKRHARAHSHQTSLSLVHPPPTPASSTTGRPSTPQPSTPTSRITSFLRRSPPSPPPDSSHISSQHHQQLLETERTARLLAEQKLQSLTAELEELSASLFTSANEMVAEERRKRAMVEERCRVLEEREKRGGERLEGLGRAVERIERVRGVLQGGKGGG